MLAPQEQRSVPPGEIGIGVEADGGQLQLAGKRAAVECLDVDQLVAKRYGRCRSCPGQGVEHEGVVGIGAMAHADELAAWFTAH